MPRSNRPPAYRLHKARHCAVVTIHGKDHCLAEFGSAASHEKYARLKLRQKDNETYRLPTEAEWEYARRAGTTAPFYCGQTISTDQIPRPGSLVSCACRSPKRNGGVLPNQGDAINIGLRLCFSEE